MDRPCLPPPPAFAPPPPPPSPPPPPPLPPPPLLPPPPAPTSPGPATLTVTLLVLGVLATLVASAVVYGVSWFASCGPAIIGYAEPEPPEIETLQFTLGGYVLAAVLAALGPAIGLYRSVRRNATVGIVVCAVLLSGVAVLFVPPIHDVARALVAGRPGDYCIQPGYTGG